VPDVNLPDGHARAGDNGQTNGSRETLVTLRVIVLEADLEFDGFEKVPLLGFERVFEKLLDVGTHSGYGTRISVSVVVSNGRYDTRTDCDFRHDDSLPVELLDSNGEDLRVVVGVSL
jgi:hypothetical protein